MDQTIDIIDRILKAKENFIIKTGNKPTTLVVDPYTGAALREHLGMDDFDELTNFKNMKVAYALEHNGEEFKVL